MRIIDLFSGAGGLTFGFYYRVRNNRFIRNKKSKFVFANDVDTEASKAFIHNFPDITMINRDIKSLTDEEIYEMIDGEPVDIIIGGPPCQSFSTVGQRIYDEKATLYEEYLRVLRISHPKMFVFENVKGILYMKETYYAKDENGKIKYETVGKKKNGEEKKKPIITGYGKPVIDVIKNKFANIDNTLGYTISCDILNAMDYGVPQNRERVFIVGVRNDLSVKWVFPNKHLGTPLRIKDAISDMPEVSEGETRTRYEKPAQNDYQRLMRNNSEKLTEHYCGEYGEKMRVVIRNVKQGQGRNDFNKLVKAGKIDKKYELTSGYSNTYGRTSEDQPAPTITHNMTAPSGIRCIHYAQNRALTPREGARIQSFPDDFSFSGYMGDVTSQIGNAVPPLMALELAKQVEKTIRKLG
ncbi:MAG: DNA cytosine methyltransferase [Lachnospiraceae bacterium]|nr:DNA cytosine methyltransferase [Lachnospiraceae bacterium]